MSAAPALVPARSRTRARPELVQANERLPACGDGLVPRTRLIRGLLEARTVPLVLLVAPAGYGKTTAVAQWARRDRRPFAWLNARPEDEKPGGLPASIAHALDTIEPVDPGLLDERRLPEAKSSSRRRSALLRCLRSRRRPFVLVVDGAEVLRKRASYDLLTAIVDELPAGSQLALVSRNEPAMPVGRLRAHREVAEFRCRELVMTNSEAALLLSATGLNLGRREVEALVRRTEGWAVGLYLAALSLREYPDSPLEAPSGDARLLADYLRDEVLSGLPRDRITFLVRASVLRQLSGPACDAVLERSDSARVLAELARSNRLVFEDGSDGSYRFHSLLARMLRAELRRLEPRREAELHRRVAAWHARNDDMDAAISHAVEAADVGSVGGLLCANLSKYISYGRNAAVEGWLGRFSHDQIAAHPALALVAGTCRLVAGDRNLAEHWTSAAQRGLGTTTQPDLRRSIEAGVTILRAGIAADGLARMGEDAARANALLNDQSAWRSACCLLAGVSRHLTRDRDAARSYLEEGARRGAVAAPNLQALCLAQLALIAIEEGDWCSGEALATRARAQIERFGLSDYPTSALVFAVSAAVRARRGRVDQAKADAAWATHLMAMLTDFAPWYDVETRVALSWAALRLSDFAGPRRMVAEAERLTRGTPGGAPVLEQWLEQLRRRLDCRRANRVAADPSLTTAELRVLQFLPTHLSFPEVAEQLNVSANTVKTHARAVYRKLDASSRTEAVAYARNAGLIDSGRLVRSEV